MTARHNQEIDDILANGKWIALNTPQIDTGLINLIVWRVRTASGSGNAYLVGERFKVFPSSVPS